MRTLFGAEPPASAPSVAEVLGLLCAEEGCGGSLRLRFSEKTGRHFYGCDRYPGCRGILPCGHDGQPSGEPRTRELQGWRKKAHDALDAIWKGGHAGRGGAYLWLRKVTGLEADRAHIFQFSIEQCQEVIRFVAERGPGTPWWDEWKGKNPEAVMRARSRGGRKKRK